MTMIVEPWALGLGLILITSAIVFFFFRARPECGSEHPAIQAMLKMLPDEGETFTLKQKRKWFTSMRAIIDVTYPED